MDNTIFIIDGYGQIYRSYFAFISNPLRDSQGNNVSAVYGFFNNLLMLLRKYQPEYLVVAMDSSCKTFRHQLYPQYKENREKTPQDLYTQIAWITDILDKMNIKHVNFEGMEADDVIATFTKNCSLLGIDSVIVTGDKDLMQLVNDRVFALRPPRKTEHDYRFCKTSDVEEIFGVKPCQICDYLTILGDKSDNIPGIDGIGEKGAVKLLSQYGTLDAVYSAIGDFSSSIRNKLEKAKDGIELSRTLITLKNDLFSTESSDLEQYRTDKINWQTSVHEFAQIGSKKLSEYAEQLVKIPESENIQIYIPEEIAVDVDNYEALIGYNLKDKIKELKKQGIVAKPYFDIMIAAWLLNSSKASYDFDLICKEYLGSDSLLEDYTQKVKKVYYVLDNELKKNNLDKIFYNLEMPLVSILSEMEDEGILLDKICLKNFETELNFQINELETDIYNFCGHPFKIGSPKQLQEVLFVEQKLPAGKKNKSGYSTDSEVLEDLAKNTDNLLPAMILRYRALTKLLSTYVVTLPVLTDDSNRVHTTFFQIGTATGRLSSKNPNLQNIPIRTQEGKKIRDAFMASEGCKLVSADYAQIELAVFASLSGDPMLCDSFIKGEDVHTKTASLIFNIAPELITEEQRRIAKTINFGVIYGMSAFRLAQELNISRSEAKKFIDKYFERYSQIETYIESVIQYATEKKEVATQMGHVRAVPDINSENKTVRNAAERVAVNSVIQGTAAEIVKQAMINVSSELKKRNLKSKILLQVHDEIILEVPNTELETVCALVKDCMEGVNCLSVPLRVAVSYGDSWGLL